MKLSIIVPVYNTFQYLPRCLDSLVKQNLNDYEIIIVNDGSPDNSQDIIDEYVKRYDNIKAYKKENGGLSDARNYGIAKASGEYIAFVDSDDYVANNMYELMYNKAKEKDYDMVVCDLNYVYPDKIIRVSSSVGNDTNDIKKTMINIYPAAWNKIYKKVLFEQSIRFKGSLNYRVVKL